jgi:hypothetical protein
MSPTHVPSTAECGPRLPSSTTTHTAAVRDVGCGWLGHTGQRNLNGLRAPIEFSQGLLDERADYGATHGHAAAFRWRRIGRMSEQLDALSIARGSLLRSPPPPDKSSVTKHSARTYGTHSSEDSQ